MKKLILNTEVIVPDKDEDLLYRYLDVNGYKDQVSEAKNTGGFDKFTEAGRISVRVKASVSDVAESEPSPESQS
ncbi:MAG: hypothetical protein NVS9B9_27920 [Ktedonobacteraceae bacterium]